MVTNFDLVPVVLHGNYISAARMQHLAEATSPDLTKEKYFCQQESGLLFSFVLK